MEITDGVNICDFKIVVLVTLTLHVSDDGTNVGVPIVGATFYRCDSEGTTYGDAVVSDDVNAVFNYVSYFAEGMLRLYILNGLNLMEIIHLVEKFKIRHYPKKN